ncbi:unnamed protein product, partial [Didymodactylos carnosus]
MPFHAAAVDLRTATTGVKITKTLRYDVMIRYWSRVLKERLSFKMLDQLLTRMLNSQSEHHQLDAHRYHYDQMTQEN